MTPLIGAVAVNNLEMVRYLRESGADVNVVTMVSERWRVSGRAW